MTAMVVTMAMTEQAFGSGRITSQVMPTLAMATLTWVLIGVGCAILVGLGTYRAVSKKQSRPGKTLPPAKKNVASAGNFFDRKPAPGQLTTAGRPTEEKVQPQPGGILSMAHPGAASSAVKLQAQKEEPESVALLILALNYCQLCQVGENSPQKIPNEFVRAEAAKALGRFRPSAFRNLAQVLHAIESVWKEICRKEAEADQENKEVDSDRYYICLTEVLESLLGLLKTYLNQMPPGESSRAQVEEELRRFKGEDGQLRVEQFTQDPIFKLLLEKSEALLETPAPAKV